MNYNRSLFTALFFCIATAAFSQHDHNASNAAPVSPMTFSTVLTQALSDDLKDYKTESFVMTIVPGGTDTVAHRHDCELFGYVLEGDVEIGLDKKEPDKFTAGQMFYERRNILHSFTRNPNKEKAAKVLLVFIIKEGRVRYNVEYPAKK